MTPVLLDQKTLFKAGISVSLSMAVVFCGGYYIGHQKAVGNGMELNKTIALALPKPAHADTAELGPQQPETLSPGAEIDVDSPDSTVAGGEAEKSRLVPGTEAAVAAAIKDTTDNIEKSVSVDSAVDTSQPLQLALLTTAPAMISTDSDAAASRQKVKQVDEPGIDGIVSVDEAEIGDTATAEDARYTIQVGVFSDAGNALRRQAELEAQQLSAYINGYSNKRDQLRFSVRFGYFKYKSSAVAALNHFENEMSGSGYVARIRRN